MAFAIATFDLKNPTRQDYDKAYAALETLGLTRNLGTLLGGYTLPTTTVAGTVGGADTNAAADDLCNRAKRAFEAKGLRGAEIFVLVAAGGHHCHRVTT
jgi:hypothetical protein